jgi:hypothetical protein
MKHLVLDLTQIGVSFGLEVENKFRCIGDYFKHLLLELQGFAFCAG